MTYDINTITRHTSAAELGSRAAKIRLWLGLSIDDVSKNIGFAEKDIDLFERTGKGSVELLLALSCALSSGDEAEKMFQTPKFTSLEQVTAFERRRVSR